MYEAVATRYTKEECTDCDGANPCTECDELSRSEIEATLIPNYEPMEEVNDTMVTDEGEEVSVTPVRATPILADRTDIQQLRSSQNTPQPVPGVQEPANVSKKEPVNEEENSKKLWMWVGIGVGILILIVMIIAILKKK